MEVPGRDEKGEEVVGIEVGRECWEMRPFGGGVRGKVCVYVVRRPGTVEEADWRVQMLIARSLGLGSDTWRP